MRVKNTARRGEEKSKQKSKEREWERVKIDEETK